MQTQETLKSMTGHAFTQFELLNAFVKNLKHFKLTPNTKWVIAELITHFNPRNAYIFPKQKTIADNIGISEASVIRAISQLHKDGLIISERKYTNRYIFTPKFLNLCGLCEKKFTPDKMQVENEQIESIKLANCDLHEHEQIKEQKTQQRVVKIFPEKKQEIDKYLLKHVQSLQGIKNDEKFARWLIKTGQSEQIISDMKQAERNSKAMLKKTENLIKQQKEDALTADEMPEFFKDFGEKLKSYCKQ